jgi:hypothetical protein
MRTFHPMATAIIFVAGFSIPVHGEGVFTNHMMKDAHQFGDLTPGTSFAGQISVIIPLANESSDVVPALDSFKIRFVELELTLVHGLYLKFFDFKTGGIGQLQIIGTNLH